MTSEWLGEMFEGDSAYYKSDNLGTPLLSRNKMNLIILLEEKVGIKFTTKPSKSKWDSQFKTVNNTNNNSKPIWT